jgi:hypothetical protein
MPFPEYPWLQVHTAEPLLSVQVAWVSQPPLFVAQGPLWFCSAVQVIPLPMNPPLQAHVTWFVAFTLHVALALQPPLFVAHGLTVFCGNRKQPEPAAAIATIDNVEKVESTEREGRGSMAFSK